MHTGKNAVVKGRIIWGFAGIGIPVAALIAAVIFLYSKIPGSVLKEALPGILYKISPPDRSILSSAFLPKTSSDSIGIPQLWQIFRSVFS